MNRVAFKRERIGELDFLRGLALLAMVYFHCVFDLKALYNIDVNIHSGPNFYIGKFSAILFIFISGISCLLSRNIIKRGIKVLLCAMCITVITYIFDAELIISFGILHFLGTCMIISPVLKKLNQYILILTGAAALFTGVYLIPKISVSYNLLFAFGITNGNFKSSDYYPLFPWLGVFLLGMAVGKMIYKNKRSILGINIGKNPINLLGRHTLVIYMVHQPLIIAILSAANYFFKFSVK
jgi:uncharacterized membrane protein